MPNLILEGRDIVGHKGSTIADYQSENKLQPIYENVFGGHEKRLKLEGTAILCEVEGINGRIYTSSHMDNQAKKYTKNYIETFNSLGELNHPAVTSEGEHILLPVTEINLEKACHLIEKLYMVGDELKIKSRVITDLPCGAIIAALVKNGIPVGNSLRGLGSIYKMNGKLYVADDYELITVDIVGRPSYGKSAMLHAITEAVNAHEIPLLTEAVEKAVREFKQEVDYNTKRHNVTMETSYHSINKLLEALKG
ncbi:MAG: hypothetical protein WC358_05260 [Ignavibacteria bacterium]|jgi:hypothetical protein